MSKTTNLISIANTKQEERTADVIFIHGLGGDALDTWRHPKNKQNPTNFWLTWLGADFPQIGIWSLAYEVEPIKWRGNTMPLVDRAINSLDLLKIYDIGKRPIFFVCHSMGGLLVKQMLRSANDSGDNIWLNILENTRGIVYLATPHTGSGIASLLDFIQVAKLVTSDSVRELKAHSPQLRELNQAHRNNKIFNQIPIKVYMEGKPTKLIGKVVDETSADPGRSGVQPIMIMRDHINIVKPESPDDQVYLGVKQFIANIMSNSVQSFESEPDKIQNQTIRDDVKIDSRNNNTKMNLNDITKNGILKELASTFNEEDTAVYLLDVIDFPGYMRPKFPTQGITLGYWQKICRQIDNGILPSGNDLQSLIDAAADYYEGNILFQKYRS